MGWKRAWVLVGMLGCDDGAETQVLDRGVSVDSGGAGAAGGAGGAAGGAGGAGGAAGGAGGADAQVADAQVADAQVDAAPLDARLPDACVPACEGRTCGPDGCGEACGTCAPGEVCADGTCEREGCAADRFECSGVCVDLQTNPAHCGRCVTDCAVMWPPALSEAGIERDAAGAVPLCVDAECAVGCPGTGPIDLLSDTRHCGACGQACLAVGLAPSPARPRCRDGACGCFAAVNDTAHAGQPCPAWCQLSSAIFAMRNPLADPRLPWEPTNCDGGCCPEVAYGGESRLLAPLEAQRFIGLALRLAAPQRVLLQVTGRCRTGETLLVWAIGADGRYTAVPDEEGQNCQFLGVLPAGLTYVIAGATTNERLVIDPAP